MAVVLAVGLMPLPAFGDDGAVSGVSFNGATFSYEAHYASAEVDADGNVIAESADAYAAGASSAQGNTDAQSLLYAQVAYNNQTRGRSQIDYLAGYSAAGGTLPLSAGIAALGKAEEEQDAQGQDAGDAGGPAQESGLAAGGADLGGTKGEVGEAADGIEAPGLAGAAGEDADPADTVAADAASRVAAALEGGEDGEADPDAAGEAGEPGPARTASQAEDDAIEVPAEVEDMDFSAARLIVALADGAELPARDEGNVASSARVAPASGSPADVYLLQFASALDARRAYVRYTDGRVPGVAFAAPDAQLGAADGGDDSEDPEDPDDPDGAALPATGGADGAHDDPADGAARAAAESGAADLASIAGEAAKVAGEADATGAAPGSERPLVALVDTGAPAHPNVVSRSSALEGATDDDLGDDSGGADGEPGHGTAMLGAILAEDPGARIASVKALGADGRGTAAAVYAAVEQAVAAGARIVNLSFAGYATESNAAIDAAVADAAAAGAVVVAAAGNSGADARFFTPASAEGAFTVGAADGEGSRLASSNYGDCVDAYVIARSTSYAAARATGWLSANGVADGWQDALRASDLCVPAGDDGGEDAEPPDADGDDDGTVQAAAQAYQPVTVKLHIYNSGTDAVSSTADTTFEKTYNSWAWDYVPVEHSVSSAGIDVINFGETSDATAIEAKTTEGYELSHIEVRNTGGDTNILKFGDDYTGIMSGLSYRYGTPMGVGKSTFNISGSEFDVIYHYVPLTAEARNTSGTAYAFLKNGNLTFFRSSTAPSGGTWSSNRMEGATVTYTDATTGKSITRSGGIAYRSFETTTTTNDADRPWYVDRANIKAVYFAGTIAPKRMQKWFCQDANNKYTNLVRFYRIQRLDTSQVTSLSDTFRIPNLATLDVSTFDLSSCETMASAFNGAAKLTSLSFDGNGPKKSVGMRSAFQGMTSATSIAFGGWSNVKLSSTGGISTFLSCEKLTSLDLSSFNTSDCNSFYLMFGNCKTLTSLDLSNFNTAKVSGDGSNNDGAGSVNQMFANCFALETLDLTGWDLSGAKNVASMFEACSKLKVIYASPTFTMTGATSTDKVLYSCSALYGSETDGDGKQSGNGVAKSYLHTYTKGNPGVFTDKYGYGKLWYLCMPGYTLGSGVIARGTLSQSGSSYTITKADGATESRGPAMVGSGYVNPVAYDASQLGRSGTSLWLDGDSSGVKWGSQYYLDIASPIKCTDCTRMFAGLCGALQARLSAKSLSMLDTSEVKSMRSMFTGFSSMNFDDVSQLDTSNVTDFSYMFSSSTMYYATGTLSFDTSNATNMEGMFSSSGGYQSLSLDVSRLDTQNVTNMKGMFKNFSFSSISGLNNWRTSNVTDMSDMFNGANYVSTIDITSFDTSNVTSFAGMFNGCSKLSSLNISNLDTTKATSLNSMFQGCSSLTELDLKPFANTSATNFASMFQGCSSLTSIDLTNLNTSNATNLSNLFYGCSALTEIDLTPLDSSKATSMGGMFASCTKLTSIDLSPLDTSNATSFDGMFQKCTSLTTVDLSPLDTTHVTNLSNMFLGSGITSIDLAQMDTSGVTSFAGMFNSCTGLTELSFEGVNLTSATSLADLVSGCTSLKSVDFTGCAAPNLTSVSNMFGGCTALKVVYADSGFSISSVGSGNQTIFTDCSNLVGWVSDSDKTYAKSKNTNTYARLATASAEGYFTDKYNYGKLWAIGYKHIHYRTHIRRGVLAGDADKGYTVTSADGTTYSVNKSGIATNFFVYEASGFGQGRGLWYDGNEDGVVVSNGKEILGVTIDSPVKCTDCTNMFRNMGYGLNPDALEVSDLEMLDTSEATSMSGMFQKCFINIGIASVLDTSHVTDFSNMFKECGAKSSIATSPGFTLHIDTSSATNMSGMFYQACSTEGNNTSNPNWSVDAVLSGFDTSNVTDMSDMFKNATRLKTINLSGFKASKLTTATGMFSGCNRLTTIYTTNSFNTSALASGNSTNMFSGNSALVGENGTKFSSSNANDCTYAVIDTEETPGYFTLKMDGDAYGVLLSSAQGGYSAGTLVLTRSESAPSGTAPNQTITTLSGKTLTGKAYTGFEGSLYSESDAAPWAESGATAVAIDDTVRFPSFAYLFSGMSNAKEIKGLNSIYVPTLKNMESMFAGCSSLTSTDVGSLDTSRVTNMHALFKGASSLETIDLDWDTSAVTNMGSMFQGCTALKRINVTDAFTNAAVNFDAKACYQYTFHGCVNLAGSADYVGNVCDGTNDTSAEFAKPGTELVRGYLYSGESAAYAYIKGDTLTFFRSYVEPTGSTWNDNDWKNGSAVTVVYYDVNANELKTVSNVKVFRGFEDYEWVPSSSDSPKTTEELTKYPRFNLDGNVKYVDFAGAVHPKTTYYWFHHCGSLAFKHAELLDTSHVVSMYEMFAAAGTDKAKCENLDLTNLLTGGAPSVYYMFENVNITGTLNLDGWDLSEFTSLENIWPQAASTRVDTIRFGNSLDNIPKLTKTGGMFQNVSVRVIDMSRKGPMYVENISYLFYGCRAVKQVDITGWASTQLTGAYNVFGETSNLEVIYASGDFDLSQVTNAGNIFHGNTTPKNLKGYYQDSATYTAWDGNHVGKDYARTKTATREGYFTDWSTYGTPYLLYENSTDSAGTICRGTLTTSNASGYTVKTVTAPDGRTWTAGTSASSPGVAVDATQFGKGTAVLNGKSLGSLSIEVPITVSSAKNMFSGVTGSLVSIKGLENLTTTSATNFSSMFANCQNVTSLDLSALDTSAATDLSSMFSGCTKLSSINLAGWDTGNVSIMDEMFKSCAGLTALDLSSFDTARVTTMSSMFEGCSNLVDLDITNWSASSLNVVNRTFADCAKLEAIYASAGFSMTAVEKRTNVTLNCTALYGHETGGNGKLSGNNVDRDVLHTYTAGNPGVFTERSRGKVDILIPDEPAPFTVYSLTIASAGKSWGYDGAAHTNASYTAAIDDGTPVAATASSVSGGDYEVTFKLEDDVEATVYIKRAASATITNYAEGGIANDFEYSFSEGADQYFDPVQKQVGTLQITRKAVTVTAAAKSRQYGQANPEFTYTSTAMVGSDTVASVLGGDLPALSTAATQTGSGPGTYDITWASASAAKGNYAFTFTGNKLTVTQREAALVVTADSASKDYDGKALTKATYQITTGSLVEGDAISDVVFSAASTVTNAGSADNVISSLKVKKGATDVTSWYKSVTYAKGKLTVNPKAATVTTGTASKQYDGTALTSATASIEGLVGDDAATVTATGSQTEVGTSDNTYSIDFTKGKAGNYTVSDKLGKLTVTANAGEVVLTAASDTKVYDGAPLTDANVTATGLPAGFTVAASASGSQTNAGSSANAVADGYAILNASGEDKTANFTKVTKVPGTLKVTPAPYTVTTTSASREYDGTALSAGASIGGLVNGETATVTATGSQTHAGTSQNGYELAWDGTAKESNYTLQSESLGDLVVSRRPVSVSLDVAHGSTAGADGAYPWTGAVEVVTVATAYAGSDEAQREKGGVVAGDAFDGANPSKAANAVRVLVRLSGAAAGAAGAHSAKALLLGANADYDVRVSGASCAVMQELASQSWTVAQRDIANASAVQNATPVSMLTDSVPSANTALEQGEHYQLDGFYAKYDAGSGAFDERASVAWPTDAGAYWAKVVGKGNYTGTAAVKVIVGADDLSDASGYQLSASNSPATFTGSGITPAAVVSDLSADSELDASAYELAVYESGASEPSATYRAGALASGQAPSLPGTYELRAYGVGSAGYRGTATGSFTIVEAPLSAASFSVADLTYRAGLVPTPTLTFAHGSYAGVLGRDFSVSYTFPSADGASALTGLENLYDPARSSGGAYAVTATYTALPGSPYQAGTTATAMFKVKGTTANLAEGTVFINATQTYARSGSGFVYTGSAIRPAVTVYPSAQAAASGTGALKAGVDYLLAYSNNVNVGRAAVTAVGIGSYKGKATTSFRIVAASSAAAGTAQTAAAAGTAMPASASPVNENALSSAADSKQLTIAEVPALAPVSAGDAGQVPAASPSIQSTNPAPLGSTATALAAAYPSAAPAVALSVGSAVFAALDNLASGEGPQPVSISVATAVLSALDD